jgi:hypothetical protein
MLSRTVKWISLVVCFALSACHSHSGVIHYIQHPDTLKLELQHCQGLTVDQIRHDSDCMQAIYAYEKLYTLSKQLMANPELYGQKIMTAQQKLAELKTQLQITPADQQSALQSQVDAIENWIQ